MSQDNSDDQEAPKKKALEGLFPNVGDTYKDNDKYRDHLLEQYKIFVEMADKISERRSTANNFFLSVNGFLLSILGILPQFRTTLAEFNLVWVVVVAVAGIAFCATWIRAIKNYAKLNEAKYTIIGEIEKKLPSTPYLTEWVYLTKDKDAADKVKKRGLIKASKYFPLTRIEVQVPWVCIILYIGMIVGWYLIYTGVVQVPLPEATGAAMPE